MTVHKSCGRGRFKFRFPLQTELTDAVEIRYDDSILPFLKFSNQKRYSLELKADSAGDEGRFVTANKSNDLT